MTEITLQDVFAQKHNPYPAYARLREQGPLARWNWMGQDMWLATTYEDIIVLLKDPRLTIDMQKLLPPGHEQSPGGGSAERYVPLAGMRHLLNTDLPDHSRLRTLVSKAFTPRMIEQLRPRIQQIADDLLDAVQEQGEMDLVANFAFPLPIIVISEMLGVPSEDRQQFRTWTQTIVQSQGAALSSEKQAAGRAAEAEFINYVKTLIATKRKHPDNSLTSDLVRVEEQGDKLSENELISMIFLLLTAGHETTVNLLGNGTLALLEHTDQLELLRSDPGLLPSAIEELLRYTTPVSLTAPRWALEDIVLHDQVIRRGEMVRCALLGANTDPQEFADPEALNILRQENQHLAFSKGIHFCLGAPLARLEGQVALGTLLRRLPNLRLAVSPEQVAYKDAGSLRAIAALPVKF
ncbi:polyketide biosynthesis cytochrome P450 PksS [Ktedonobacter sp. SOSP1-52]|uniref:cytochrome P450 family protein n=1 Tax=Ktedonobacter sp. SOSP1-52 TaxID=2778366 RepID=UPI0019153C9A|nr:cytochrome P450 [Ktedonobacter sp. SOSP1-52]GHO62463.1 polyketide biosynthesis cytochrome P450 PksS [Ktedonobacter sp. SOSP1-52]